MDGNNLMDKVKDVFNANSDIITLPLQVNDSRKVFAVLYERLDTYLDMVKSVDLLENYHNDVAWVINTIKNIIESYFRCDDITAYSEMKKLIIFFQKLPNTYVVVKLNQLFSEYDSEQFEWYRGRVGTYQSRFNYVQMSHVPFSARGCMSNARYSINGVPCLYVSNSVYCAWEELHRPNFDSLWVSKINLENTEFKVLNLSITGGDFLNPISLNKDFDFESKLCSFILSWPIQCACSIITDNFDNNFKEEYIFPQILMRVAYNLDFGAIMYFSNRVKNIYTKDSSWILRNLAIPAFDFKDISCGYSPKIANLIEVSNPINIGLLSNDLVNQEKLTKSNTNHLRNRCRIMIDNEASVLYPNTIFSFAEVDLYHRNTYKLPVDD